MPEAKLKEQSTNGHQSVDLGPQTRIEAFQRELIELQQKHRVKLVGFIKTYNTGQQVADFEIIPEQ